MVDRDDAIQGRGQDRALARLALAHAALGAPAHRPLAQLRAQTGHVLEQLAVGDTCLAGIKLDDAQDAAGRTYRETERGAQAQSAANPARGKFGSSVSSTIQAAFPVCHTRPGNPRPRSKRVSFETSGEHHAVEAGCAPCL